MSTEERIAFFVGRGVRFLSTMPDGWVEIKGALTAPNGYKWINKFKGGYDRALCKR